MIEIFLSFVFTPMNSSSGAQTSPTELLKQQTLVAAKVDKYQSKSEDLEKQLMQAKHEYETLKGQYKTLLKNQTAQQLKLEKLSAEYAEYKQKTEKELKQENIKLEQVQKMNRELVSENGQLKKDLKRCMEKAKKTVLEEPELEDY